MTIKEPEGKPAPFKRLNDTFYLSNPHRFFRAQLETLAMRSLRGRPEALSTEEANELFGSVPLSGLEPTDRMWSDDLHVAVEAQLLLHRVSEALLRLYFAHARNTECPWLEVVSLKAPRAFKELIEAEIVNQDGAILKRNVMLAMTGHANQPTGVDDWEPGLATLVEILRTLADVCLTDATMYNSLKHGLSASVCSGALTLTDDESGASFELDSGTVFQYLEHDDWLDGQRTWKETSYWPSSQYALRLSAVACHLIENIWKVGRQRFSENAGPIELFLPTTFGVDDLRGDDSSAHTKMTVPVAVQNR